MIEWADRTEEGLKATTYYSLMCCSPFFFRFALTTLIVPFNLYNFIVYTKEAERELPVTSYYIFKI
jgi:hypothetical protein